MTRFPNEDPAVVPHTLEEYARSGSTLVSIIPHTAKGQRSGDLTTKRKSVAHWGGERRTGGEEVATMSWGFLSAIFRDSVV